MPGCVDAELCVLAVAACRESIRDTMISYLEEEMVSWWLNEGGGCLQVARDAAAVSDGLVKYSRRAVTSAS